MNKEKHKKNKANIFRTIFIITFIVCIVIIIYYLYAIHKEKKQYNQIFDNIIINETEISEQKTERMLQLEELKKENDEIIGWLEIEGTNINYPVLQAADNDYYLTHNYKKETVATGSLFLDKDFDIVNGSSNYLIFGHRNKQGLMFEDLMKYSNEEFYKEHPKIKFTTIEEDVEYEIISVFYSRVYYKDEKNVFRYYYFINANSKEEYDEYVSNAKKVSIYNIDKTAVYGEQLLTLSTCEYSQEDGRFVVVAKKTK